MWWDSIPTEENMRQCAKGHARAQPWGCKWLSPDILCIHEWVVMLSIQRRTMGVAGRWAEGRASQERMAVVRPRKIAAYSSMLMEMKVLLSGNALKVLVQW